MLEAMLCGLKLLMSWKVVGLILFATLLGNFFGAVPGLGGMVGLALLIPFVFGMEPFHGLAFLLAMHAVVNTGGSIPGILFGIAGTGATVATIFDGYPMTKQGRGGEAMGAQLAASCLGGVIGAFVLALFIPILRPIAMAFGSPEVFMLIMVALTSLIVISRESISKGFTGALLGLLLGTIGQDPYTGVSRFTFTKLWLWDGIQIVTIVLGIFAFAEMIELGARGRRAKIAETDVRMRWGQLWEGTLAVFREWWLSLRTAIIGTFIGILPGLGGDAAAFICYGHAVQTCKDNKNFGKGDIRGVIGVETANNAKEGGSLLPTLVFGIPGSAGMAILLGAFLILGIVPGPEMITEHLDLVWGMVWVLVIANIIGAISLYPLCGFMGKLVYLRGSLLIPPITVLAAVGAYLIRGYWEDLVLAVCFGFLGYGMKKWDFSRAPLILGIILGPLAEAYLHKSINAWGPVFLLRPVVLVLLLIVLLSLGYSVWNSIRDRQEQESQTASTGTVVFALAALVVFLGSVYLSRGWPLKASMFPMMIGITGALFSVWIILTAVIRLRALTAGKENKKMETSLIASETATQTISTKSEVVMMLWLLGFLLLILIFGFWVAIAAFTALFMPVFGRENWKLVTTYTAGIWLGIYLVFAVGMKVPLYPGLLGLSLWSGM